METGLGPRAGAARCPCPDQRFRPGSGDAHLPAAGNLGSAITESGRSRADCRQSYPDDPRTGPAGAVLPVAARPFGSGRRRHIRFRFSAGAARADPLCAAANPAQCGHRIVRSRSCGKRSCGRSGHDQRPEIILCGSTTGRAHDHGRNPDSSGLDHRRSDAVDDGWPAQPR